MVKSHILKLAAVAAMSLPLVAQAGTVVKAGKDSKAVVEEVSKSCITGDLGVNIVSEYIWRGLVQENQGVIAQPYLNLYFSLYKGEGFVNAVSLNLGTWSSVHSHAEPLYNQGSSDRFYENDYSAGVAVTFAKNFALTTTFTSYNSPSDVFESAEELSLKLAYNDSDLLGAYALHPYALVAFDLGDSRLGFDDRAFDRGPAADDNLSGSGIYYELGIAPSYALVKDGAYPVTVTLPITLGLGNSNYYNGDSFGYVSAGLNFAVGLGFVPSCYGTWTANAGVTYYHLGGGASEYADYGVYNQYAQGGAADGSDDRVVFSGGIGLAF